MGIYYGLYNDFIHSGTYLKQNRIELTLELLTKANISAIADIDIPLCNVRSRIGCLKNLENTT